MTHAPAPPPRALPRPDVLPPGPWSFPTSQETELDNGLRVAAYHLPGQKVISATLTLDVPLSIEPRDQEGLAALCCRVLDEGTQAHPGEEFAQALEACGAGFGASVSLAGLEVVLDVPATRLATALGLLAEAVTAPTLTDTDVARHVSLRLGEIEQARANSAATASNAFRANLFDDTARAARMNGGEPDTVATLTGEQVRAFHASWFVPNRGTLVLGGDFTDDPFRLVADAFGPWRPGPDLRVPAAAPALAGPSAVLVHRPGAVAADVRLGGPGIDRHDPRWADVTLAAYAMGGAFASRLNSVLREERGYTYGVQLGLTPLRSGGMYAMSGSFRTAVVVDALVEGREILGMARGPFTADEIADAHRFYAGITPLRYATADGVVDQRAALVLGGLPADHTDRFLADLAAVTPASATTAFREVVAADPPTLVIAGDAETLAEPLRAAGYPELVVVETGTD